jgi:hypothetical protein
VLAAALALAALAGLRAYLPLLVVAIASHIPIAPGRTLIPLAGPFHWVGSGWFIALLVVLALAESIVDKIPLVDHLSDAVHTVIRPAVGAVIVAGTANSLSLLNPWVAAALGAGLALAIHAAKAASRPVVTATTAGIGNPLVSLGEDVVVVVLAVLAAVAPFLALALLIAFVVVMALLIRAGWRRLRARRARGAAGGALGARVAASASPGGSPTPGGAPTGGMEDGTVVGAVTTSSAGVPASAPTATAAFPAREAPARSAWLL